MKCSTNVYSRSKSSGGGTPCIVTINEDGSVSSVGVLDAIIYYYNDGKIQGASLISL